LLYVRAVRIIGAARELAVTALLQHQIRLAPWTLLVENLIRLRCLQATLLGGNQLARRLALGITRTRQELTEAPSLDHHCPPAVLARLDFLFATLRLGLAFL